MHRLITIVFSHYNEKARWALELAEVPFVEEPYMPGFHFFPVAAATRGRGGAPDRSSSRFSTPILVTDQGRVLTDSSEIARFAFEQGKRVASMYPNPDVTRLIDHFGAHLGPHTRTFAYWRLLPHTHLLRQLGDGNVSPKQARLFRRAYPLVRALLVRGLGLTEKRYERSLARIREELDAAAKRLEGRAYLAGDSFTAADLTFAALLAPALCVSDAEGYGARLPALTDLDDETQALVAELRAHPAGAHALKVYRDHRRPPTMRAVPVREVG